MEYDLCPQCPKSGFSLVSAHEHDISWFLAPWPKRHHCIHTRLGLMILVEDPRQSWWRSLSGSPPPLVVVHRILFREGVN